MRFVELPWRRLLAAGLALLACRVTAIQAADQSLQRFEFTEVHMAVDFRIVQYAADEVAAKQAASAAFARIKQLDEELSDYKADSELSRLSDTAPTPQPIHVSDDLWRSLGRGEATLGSNRRRLRLHGGTSRQAVAAGAAESRAAVGRRSGRCPRVRRRSIPGVGRPTEDRSIAAAQDAA